jgi:tetratricopeptide (TPR) repeat protein
VERVLAAFADLYLVNILPPDDDRAETQAYAKPLRYELIHDHLITVLLEAPDPFLQHARAAQDQLRFWTDRSSELFAKEPGGKIGRFRSWYRQPIPLIITVKFLVLTKDPRSREILFLSFRGAILRSLTVLGVASVGYAAYVNWTRTDVYLLRYIARNAPVKEAADAGADASRASDQDRQSLTGWIDALISADLLDDAIAAAHQVRFLPQRVRLLSKLATRLQERNRMADADATWLEALKSVKQIGDLMDRSRSLIELSQDERNYGRVDQANTILYEALDAAKTVWDGRSYIFAELALAFDKAKEPSIAADCWSESTRAAINDLSPWGVGDYTGSELVDTASAMLRAGRTVEAENAARAGIQAIGDTDSPLAELGKIRLSAILYMTGKQEDGRHNVGTVIRKVGETEHSYNSEEVRWWHAAPPPLGLPYSHVARVGVPQNSTQASISSRCS